MAPGAGPQGSAPNSTRFMDHQIFFAAGDLMELAKSTGETFGFQKQLFFSQVISFCVIAFALHRFAYKPILNVLEERKLHIAESLANADKIKAELASAQTKSQEIIGQAGEQASKIIAEARAIGAKEVEKASQAAIATANQIIAKAREANEAELARMKTELRREVGRLVVNTTAKVTGKILTTDDQNRLADETNRQLAAN
jgi:F-type H+-transporting ATPase subunit b